MPDRVVDRGGSRSAAVTIMIFCAAQVMTQIGAMTFPALLPVFFDEWALSHSQAGWLSGVIFGAYALAVPILVTATDRFDPRPIYIASVALTVVSHLGMALLADGFWLAFLFRVLAGVGWAGTYMVGLRALTDQIEGPAQSRAVAFHAGSIGVSGALSFVLAGQINAWFGWEAAFVGSACGALGALLVASLLFPGRPDHVAAAARERETALFAFGPVFRNRSAMAYIMGYCVHTWEMFVVRSWVVTFLAFSAAQQAEEGVFRFLIPTVVATLMELLGAASSILGNEMALKYGRERWVICVMLMSMALALVVGFTAGLGYGVATAVCLVYNTVIYADSSTLTAGTVGSAAPNKRGATLAVHAFFGYSGGFVGPWTMGILLDLLGGETVRNWGLGFGHVSVVLLVGFAAFLVLRPRKDSVAGG